MLLRQGIYYWVKSWAKCTVTAPALEGSATTPVESVPAALQGEIATIFAGIALSYRQQLEATK
jgi:hypothetical protein